MSLSQPRTATLCSNINFANSLLSKTKFNISIKKKRENFESVNQHSGWENNARGGVDIERERLTDLD